MIAVSFIAIHLVNILVGAVLSCVLPLLMCLFCSFRSSFQNSACSFQKQRNCRYSNFPYFSGFLRCNRQKSLKYQAFRQILSRPKPPSKIAKQPLIHKTRNAAYGKTKPGTGRVTQLLPVPAACSGVPKPAFAQILLTIENGICIMKAKVF